MTTTADASPAAGASAASAARSDYDAALARLRAELVALPADAPVRLAKRTSNLFRPRTELAGRGLDVSGFDAVLSVDPEARTADVGGMTTYEHLVDATLPYGLMPAVVPQLKTITLGGAVSGLGIESSSYRNGLPHESVLEMDVLTGSGEVLLAQPDGEHADLWAGLPNSYGTLGYAVRLRIALQPVQPVVRLERVLFSDPEAFFAAMEQVSADSSWQGQHIDFVDGVAFAPDELVLCLGSFTSATPEGVPLSDYTGSQVFYRSLPGGGVDYLSVRDYLWRWDTDWFWCSATFGVQNPKIRRWLPKGWLRSDNYARIVRLEGRYGVKRRIDRARGLPDRENVIQDVEVPIGRAAQFLAAFDEQIAIRPVWTCPLRVQRAEGWPLYPMEAGQTYVNFGFWASVALDPGDTDGAYNRRVEDLVATHHGHKSLYSTAFYDQDTFWRLYNGPAYRRLKQRYDPQGRLLDLYDKCVRRS